jgi:heme exporter protein CcmD
MLGLPARPQPLIRLLRSHLLPMGEGLPPPGRMTHLGYVLAAYLVTAIVLLGAVAFVALDVRVTRKKLARLEERGPRGRLHPRQ